MARIDSYENFLTDMANCVRDIKGVEDTIYPAEMDTAIKEETDKLNSRIYDLDLEVSDLNNTVEILNGEVESLNNTIVSLEEDAENVKYGLLRTVIPMNAGVFILPKRHNSVFDFQVESAAIRAYPDEMCMPMVRGILTDQGNNITKWWVGSNCTEIALLEDSGGGFCIDENALNEFIEGLGILEDLTLNVDIHVQVMYHCLVVRDYENDLTMTNSSVIDLDVRNCNDLREWYNGTDAIDSFIYFVPRQGMIDLADLEEGRWQE